MAKVDANKILAHLRAKWAGRPCPMCGVGNWNVQESLYQLTEFHEGSVVLGGSVVPVVPVTCSNCGNTVLVNGIIGGIVKPAPEAKP